jgi:hypothetical protein
VLSDVWDKRPFVFKEVDIIKPESKGWRDLYEFDVPVVSRPAQMESIERVLNRGQIHISKAQVPEEDPKLSTKAVKLMHRFTVDEVMAKMDSVEK